MPAYGMQGATLQARPGGEDDDDDDGDSQSVRSSYSTYSSASAMTKGKGNSFNISGKPSRFVTRVTINPSQSHAPGTQHTTTSTTPVQNSGGAPQAAGNGNSKRGKRGKGKKGKGPKMWDIHVPGAGTSGWQSIRLSKETADSVRLQAVNNLVSKTHDVWEDLTSQQFMTKCSNIYSHQSQVILTIQQFETAGAGNTNNYVQYDNAIKALWNFQIELKQRHSSLYSHEPSSKPYDSNMTLYLSESFHQGKKQKLNMNDVDFFMYNRAKLILYFVKSLMKYQSDSYKMPDEDALKKLKESDKNVSKTHLMRKNSSLPYNDLCNMFEVLTPWMIAITKANEVQASKYTGNNQHRVYQNGNKYGGPTMSAG